MKSAERAALARVTSASGTFADSDLETCPGCGAEFTRIDGPTHRYMESSPGCWAAFGEVLAREYSTPALMPVHRLSVDSYAVQHPGRPSAHTIHSVGVHLIRLCLFLEYGLEPDHANQAMLAAARIKKTFAWLEPPASLGSMTVRDVAAATDTASHQDAVLSWARSAWAAWSVHHERVRHYLMQSGALDSMRSPVSTRGRAQHQRNQHRA